MSAILGALFAIMLSMFGISQYVTMQKTSNDNIQAAVTAQQHQKLNEATSAYVNAYAAALQAAATATAPAVITVDMLKNVPGNLLPAEFNPQNSYQQTWQVQVLQPTPGYLQALTFPTGGAVMRDQTAARIGSLIGHAGGFIPQRASAPYPGGAGMAYGAFGGWSMATAGYTGVTGGRSASLLTFNNGQLVSNYLYRNAVPGQPQLNQMNTTLDMNGNSVTRANAVNTKTLTTEGQATIGGDVNVAGNVTTPNLTSTGKVQLNEIVVLGGACAPDAQLARDATGAILSCRAGIWKKIGGGIQEMRTFTWIPPYRGYSGYDDMGLSIDDWFCSLTTVSGKFAGMGEHLEVVRGSSTWLFGGSSQSDQNISGGATCVKL